jgi:hypothetical protein
MVAVQRIVAILEKEINTLYMYVLFKSQGTISCCVLSTVAEKYTFLGFFVPGTGFLWFYLPLYLSF